MHPALQSLLDALDLRDLGDQAYEALSPDTDGARLHLFGGQVLAQGLVAAQRTTQAGLAHSLHAYFLRRGTPREPIRFEVSLLRRSRSFLACAVTAHQSGEAIMQMSLSYHDAEPGPEHQIPMDEVGPPAGETYERVLLRSMTPAGYEESGIPFELPVEIRGVGGLAFFSPEIKPPGARCWMRVRGELPDDPVLHQCLFAYASDYAIMVPALHPHPYRMAELQTASIDHALWFHRGFRMDDWLLFELDSPIAHGARGMGRGLLYTRAGTLVASSVQEALLRPVPPPQKGL
ncbi:MAG: thioesterase family protein [Deltaproteobacteria bacterium]|nr:thioesterase family protein [Deltaproteobacteria bacterium]MBW2421417.1 thioesterase family protein [Deltaproteobacteria bacterium]